MGNIFLFPINNHYVYIWNYQFPGSSFLQHVTYPCASHCITKNKIISLCRQILKTLKNYQHNANVPHSNYLLNRWHMQHFLQMFHWPKIKRHKTVQNGQARVNNHTTCMKWPYDMLTSTIALRHVSLPMDKLDPGVLFEMVHGMTKHGTRNSGCISRALLISMRPFKAWHCEKRGEKCRKKWRCL